MSLGLQLREGCRQGWEECSDVYVGTYVVSHLYYQLTDAQSLIDLARSEKATLDKKQTRDGKHINTRLVPMSLNAHEMSLMLTTAT